MSLLASWLASPPPDAAVEIAPERVAAATITERSGGFVVSSYAVEALPPGAVLPALSGHNIADPSAVAAAVRTVIGRLDARVQRVALVIPDVTAKVSLLHFDKVPARRDDLDQLVRWQVRKSAPFAIEEACVTFSSGARAADASGDFVVVLARRDVIQEYERVCADAGVYAGIVDISTFSLLNLFLASGRAPAGDWLAVHMRPQYTSIAIMRGNDMIFFRNRPEGDEEPLADLVHQTTMYYQDRLAGQGFTRVVIGGAGRTAGAVDAARRELEERLQLAAEPIDAAAAVSVSDRISVGPDLMDVLAPLSGMLLRTHTNAVPA
jgi:type IV pilus assembly protein PilM